VVGNVAHGFAQGNRERTRPVAPARRDLSPKGDSLAQKSQFDRSAFRPTTHRRNKNNTTTATTTLSS
jgi:hypothetical protein